MLKSIFSGITALFMAIGLRIALDAWAWFYHNKRLDILEGEILNRIADFMN